VATLQRLQVGLRQIVRAHEEAGQQTGTQMSRQTLACAGDRHACRQAGGRACVHACRRVGSGACMRSCRQESNKHVAVPGHRASHS
jgi:hypothetical protein